MRVMGINRPLPESILLFLGVALLPVYAFGSGGVQPAHAVLALFAGVVLIRNGIPMPYWAQFLFATCVYVLFVESFYAIKESSSSQLINVVYYFYNFFLCVSVFSFFRRGGGPPIAVGSIAAVFLVLGSYLLISDGTGVRFTATFNNPNQLGYFSVCLVSIFYLLYRIGSFNYLFAIALIGVAYFLSILSLSKAAMVANFVVAIFVLKPAFGGCRMTALWVVGILSVLGSLYWLYASGDMSDYRFVGRLEGMVAENDSSLEARGYLAFLEGGFAQNLFGLGSAKAVELVGHEVHSTLGSIFTYYGLFGLLLFSGALVIWARTLWQGFGLIGLISLAGPVMLYGLTHNGTRFATFWILFGASIAAARTRINCGWNKQDLK